MVLKKVLLFIATFIFLVNIVKGKNIYSDAYGSDDQATLNAKRSFTIYDTTVLYIHVWEAGNITTSINDSSSGKRSVLEFPLSHLYMMRSENSTHNSTIHHNTTISNNTTTNSTQECPNEYGTVKATYFPLVDDFTLMTVPDSGLRWKYATEVIIWAELAGECSDTRHYKSPLSPGLFNGALSLVVNIDSGVISSIVWDDDKCSQCDDSSCIYETTNPNDPKNCGLEYSQTGNCDSNQFCNLQIYFAWVGTDARKVYCTSSGFLPSKADAWSVFPVYKVAAGVTKAKIFSTDPFANANGGSSSNNL